MSLATYVIGFRAPDEHWQQMKHIYDLCAATGVPLPPEVSMFFGGTAPDPRGIEVPLPVQPWQDDHREGVELRVIDIPPQVTVLRFYNSW